MKHVTTRAPLNNAIGYLLTAGLLLAVLFTGRVHAATEVGSERLEAAIEVLASTDGPNDVIDWDGTHPQRRLPDQTERILHVIEYEQRPAGPVAGEFGHAVIVLVTAAAGTGAPVRGGDPALGDNPAPGGDDSSS